MANRVSVNVSINKCNYCGKLFVLINDYGQCRGGCPGNCIELWSQKCNLPDAVVNYCAQHRKAKTLPKKQETAGGK